MTICKTFMFYKISRRKYLSRKTSTVLYIFRRVNRLARPREIHLFVNLFDIRHRRSAIKRGGRRFSLESKLWYLYIAVQPRRRCDFSQKWDFTPESNIVGRKNGMYFPELVPVSLTCREKRNKNIIIIKNSVQKYYLVKELQIFTRVAISMSF